MGPSGDAILVLLAHPYPRRSRACAAHVAALEGLARVEVRSLYDRYPDFDVDVAAEQAALATAGLVVWLHPLHWYGEPGLLKHWMEKVLAKGWAHGPGGEALRGKDCLWAVTAGGDEAAFTAAGRHHGTFAGFAAPVEATARYCGLGWLEPHVVLGAHVIEAAALERAARAFRGRLEAWRASRAGAGA